ncbi:MAG: thiamine phosphate synthase [Verrucomicrobiales bacterium]|nr:thiamine phosphate synthase [Verrucomicrobiales bacterium]MCP5556308.1 thiamine phosphate synthase [Verrucomicrobiaceae bacterium]
MLTALQNARLYGIVDLGYCRADDVPAMTRALCEGGVDILQLRAKKLPAVDVEELALQMLPITRALGVPLVINDHPQVAASVGSEGVHVGQDDDAVAYARSIVGPDCFVGKSTHSLAQAIAAQEEGADYIGFGPLYATGTKPDYVPIGIHDIAEVHRLVQLPIYCIGGVNPARIDEVLHAGAQRVVVVSAFLQAPDVQESVRELKNRLLHG